MSSPTTSPCPPARPLEIGRERLRQLLIKHWITFQSLPKDRDLEGITDPRRDAKLARIDYVTSNFPHRVFVFDEFRPVPAGRAKRHPRRLPANCHKPHGVRQFHGCYSVGDDRHWGVVHGRKGAANTLVALSRFAGHASPLRAAGATQRARRRRHRSSRRTDRSVVRGASAPALPAGFRRPAYAARM